MFLVKYKINTVTKSGNIWASVFFLAQPINNIYMCLHDIYRVLKWK